MAEGRLGCEGNGRKKRKTGGGGDGGGGGCGGIICQGRKLRFVKTRRNFS